MTRALRSNVMGYWAIRFLLWDLAFDAAYLRARAAKAAVAGLS